jgi:hypothetical protein
VKRRPEEIIGEWGVRDVTPPSQAERKKLEAEAELNPLTGSVLPRRIRRFRVEADRYLAALGGIEAQLAQLARAYEEHDGSADDWRRLAAGWDFVDVNELIERHNRWYPVEARLAMDPRTKDYVKVGGRSYRREPLDADWILEQFPPRDR